MTRSLLPHLCRSGRPAGPAWLRARLATLALTVVALLAGGCAPAPVPPAASLTPTAAPPASPSAVAVAAPSPPQASPLATVGASPAAASAALSKPFKTALASDSTFQADFPTAAVEEVQPLAGGARMTHLHTDKKGAVVYDVAWVGLAPEIAAMPPSTLVERAAAGMTASDPNARLQPRALAGLPEVPAIVVRREGADKAVSHLAVLVAQGRLYQLTVSGRPGAKVEEAEVNRFFDSFTLVAQPKTPARP